VAELSIKGFDGGLSAIAFALVAEVLKPKILTGPVPAPATTDEHPGQ
jgi:hypothetical protein